MKVGVVTFPGTLDDRDAARAATHAGTTAVSLWHGDADLKGVDAVILPGGFSYGDYLRCGAISRFAPVECLYLEFVMVSKSYAKRICFQVR
jgi:phosphoribosylformylglycinamidine synthase